MHFSSGQPMQFCSGVDIAKRLVEHLERTGFVVMKKPPIGGASALGRGYER
jgi:predicted methyltransferase